MKPIFTMRLFVAMSAMPVFILAGCTTKWTNAPSVQYPGEHFKTEVRWLPAGSGFDIYATTADMACCMLAPDEIRIPILDHARTKEAELCAPKKPSVDSDNYDPKYQLYMARITCG